MKVFDKYSPQYILTDNRAEYIILPDMQEWMAGLLFPKIIVKGTKRWAFLIGSDLFTTISIEQMTTEIEVPNIETKYIQQFFDDETDAMLWLTEK